MNPRDARLLPRCACGRPCPIGKKKCAKCLSTKKFKVIELKPSTAGKNKRGTCLHKPDKSRVKRPKRQSTGGLTPTMPKSRWGDQIL